MVRLAARKDDNQDEIVQGLRQLGISVAITHQLGGGFVDIVCGKNGVSYLFEIKDPAKPPSRRRLTDDEADFHRDWQGQIDVILTVEDALKIMGLLGE